VARRNRPAALESEGVVPDPFDDTQDDRGQRVGLAARRVVMTLFAVVALLGLTGVFGQPQRSSGATGETATLRLQAPETVRGGLFFQARVDVETTSAISQPRLVLDEGWTEGLQVNSIEPAPESESSRDGRLELSFPDVAAGERLRIWFQFEVNPTNVGRRSFAIELDDATRPLARIDRTLTVLP
jgi:hypothetical protein